MSFNRSVIIIDSISDECYSNPCQNGGTCIDEKLMLTCECPKHFGGRMCEIGRYWQFSAEKIVKFWKTCKFSSYQLIFSIKSIFMQCKTEKIQEQIKFKLVAFEEDTITLWKGIINNIRIWLRVALNLKSQRFLSRLQPEFGLPSCPQKTWQRETLTADEWCANICGKSKWLRREKYILALALSKISRKPKTTAFDSENLKSHILINLLTSRLFSIRVSEGDFILDGKWCKSQQRSETVHRPWWFIYCLFH